MTGFKKEGLNARSCSLLDATSKTTAAQFMPAETTQGYLKFLRQHLKKHGRPWAFYVDKHSIFRVNRKDLAQSIEMTHFGRVCKELGIEVICAHSPHEVGGKDFYLDLVLYHFKLRCFVLIELKATDFKPEFAGKLNFYLSAVDDLMKHPSDNPTIGILICKRKNNFIAKYALRDINKPIGVAEHETKIMNSLPKKFKSSLPTVEEIEAELSVVEPVPIITKKNQKNLEWQDSSDQLLLV